MGLFSANLKTLKIIAIYGGAISFLGAGYFATRIQDNFRQQEFYKQSMKLLRGYPIAIRLLGQPIRSRRLDLSNPDNYADGLKARLTVPVEGPKGSAILRTWCSRPTTADKWVVQRLDLEVSDKQWTFYINPQARDEYKPTGSQPEQDDELQTALHSDSELMYICK